MIHTGKALPTAAAAATVAVEGKWLDLPLGSRVDQPEPRTCTSLAALALPPSRNLSRHAIPTPYPSSRAHTHPHRHPHTLTHTQPLSSSGRGGGAVSLPDTMIEAASLPGGQGHPKCVSLSIYASNAEGESFLSFFSHARTPPDIPLTLTRRTHPTTKHNLP